MVAAALAAAGMPLPSAEAAQPGALAALLGLGPRERSWLSVLTPDERHQLQRALATAGDGPVAPRTIELLGKLVSRRSRLFAFLGYPGVADTRSVCDGLMRE
jgi:hypothetical protein